MAVLKEGMDLDDRNFEAEVIRCLTDTGCDAQTIERYRALEERTACKACARREQLRLLQQHRRHLLDELHVCQSRLDCLDYLIYRLKREDGKEMTDEP